jgi:hypothetical protein
MDPYRKIAVVNGHLRVSDNNYGALNLTTQKWNGLVRGLILQCKVKRGSVSVKLSEQQ